MTTWPCPLIRRVTVTDKPRAAPVGRPLRGELLLLGDAFARRFRLLHPLGHLGLHGVQVETRAVLHRRVIEERLEFLSYHLLDEDKSPELELKPIKVLLSAVFRAVVRPAHALERIQSQVGDIGHVLVSLFTEPALRLIDEAKLVVVDADRA